MYTNNWRGNDESSSGVGGAVLDRFQSVNPILTGVVEVL